MINAKDKVEIARQNCNNDWRSDFPTLFDRFKRVCLSNEFSDVDFVFNKGLPTETRIPAHSCVLSLASEVFEKLFAYDGDEKRRQEILVRDAKLKPDAVETMLKHIYSDFKDVADIENASVSVWDVLYAAKFYVVPSLEKHCIDFLTENLSAKNVLGVLDQCLHWEVNPDLLGKCKEMLQTETKEVLKSEEFLGISQKCLIVLLEQEKLTAAEGKLFKSALDWSKRACANNCEPTPENLRKKLGPAFWLIRFPTMSKDDFGKLVLMSNILSMQEEHDLMQMIAFRVVAPLKNPLPFSNTPRNDYREEARIIRTNVTEDVEEKVVYYANKVLNNFALTSDEIAVYIEERINLKYNKTYGRCGCVVVDQTVSDDTLVEQCGYLGGYYHYCICFALKGLKIGVHWN